MLNLDRLNNISNDHWFSNSNDYNGNFLFIISVMIIQDNLYIYNKESTRLLTN